MNKKIIDEQMGMWEVILLAQEQGCQQLIEDEKELERIEDEAGGYEDCEEAHSFADAMEWDAYRYLEDKGYVFTYLDD
jgi:hypothetical protein